MKGKVIIFVFIFSIINILLYSKNPKEELIIKSIDDNSYIIDYSLNVNIDKKVLLQICYDTSHLRNYLNKIVKLIIINSKPDSQTIAYEINFFFLYNYSIYKRQLIRAEDKIIFELTYFNQNLKFLPNILELKGFYKIVEVKDGVINFNYFQVTKIDKEVSKRDLIVAKNQIRIYFNNFKNYIKKFQED